MFKRLLGNQQMHISDFLCTSHFGSPAKLTYGRYLGQAILTAIGVVTVFMACPRQLSAQERHSFVTVGIHSDLNNQRFAGIGGGVVFDLINSWLSVGGQGDLFVSDGYVAGRAGPIGQFNFIRHRALRPFVIGGVAWGENDGPWSARAWNCGLEIELGSESVRRTMSQE
jgi:hypothetical protein